RTKDIADRPALAKEKKELQEKLAKKAEAEKKAGEKKLDEKKPAEAKPEEKPKPPQTQLGAGGAQ
ncbi:MAG TPA: hypothetical protein VLX60_09175, partial [Terriglobales bacterium]|nr:hypothetical protein [Terriglobales bacterium]